MKSHKEIKKRKKKKCKLQKRNTMHQCSDLKRVNKKEILSTVQARVNKKSNIL